MIFGDLGSLNLPDICLTGEEKPQKTTSPRKLVPTGDRTRPSLKPCADSFTILEIFKSVLEWIWFEGLYSSMVCPGQFEDIVADIVSDMNE